MWDLSWELLIEANNLVDLKHKQEKATNCLLEGRDVFAVKLTGYGKSFINCNCNDDQGSS